MSTSTTLLDERLYAYVLEYGLREPDALRRLRAETAEMEESGMQIAPEQGQFLAFLVGCTGARRTLEIGTFTGYSALAVALALPADGHVTACEANADYAAIAERHWRAAGMGERIQLRMGKARDTLAALVEEGEAGAFDFVFIDADKRNYDAYYEAALTLLRPGGLVAVDNALWHGAVADPDDTEPATEAIRALTRKMRDDRRVGMSLVPVGDGMLLARKLP